jgi:2-polyprenyl-6-methoxyphenol hydroxylase-like FAD-dependent oxidoreductase
MSRLIVVGAGPTGLMLACELRRGGCSVELIDLAPARSDTSRAAGMHVRTMEVLDQRGMLEPFEAVGHPMDAGHFAGIKLDMSTLPTRRPYMLGIMQAQTEGVLEGFAIDLGVAVQWSTEVIALEQTDTGVEVTTDGPDGVVTRHADYVVGCDGGRSAVRRLAGIPFEGTDARYVTQLGDVEVDRPPTHPTFLERRPGGSITFLPFGEFAGQTWQRVMVTEYQPPEEDSGLPSLERLRATLTRVAGTDFGIHTPHWLSQFADAARQATHYRAGRVFVAGDAAHIHPPLGGQGMNLGIQDAVNLGWKLAAVVRGDAPEQLLDTYHDERHPIAARVLENTRAQTSLLEAGDNVTAMRETFRRLVQVEQANERISAEISGLDVCYPSGAEHPVVGRRIPDCDIVIGATRHRLYELLHDARPLLIDFGAGLDVDVADTVERVNASCTVASWRLPVLGWVEVPAALLVRPDGYVAWAGDAGSTQGLHRAAERIGATHRLAADRRS